MTVPSPMAKLAADVFSQKVPSPKSGSSRTWEKVVDDAKKSPLHRGVKALSKAALPRNWTRKFKDGPSVVPFKGPEKTSSVKDLWKGLPTGARRAIGAGAVAAPAGGLAQYLMDAPLPSGQSREEIAAQSAYDRARRVNEASDSPGYASRMSEAMLRSSVDMAEINREHRLKAALLAALLSGVVAGGTGALSARIGAAAR